MKSPAVSAAHKFWSEAVLTGVQDRNCCGSTPITLTRRPWMVMAAPSTASTFRTPGIPRSAATWAVLRPAGSIAARSGRTICRYPVPVPAGAAVAGAGAVLTGAGLGSSTNGVAASSTATAP